MSVFGVQREFLEVNMPKTSICASADEKGFQSDQTFHFLDTE